jgi:hypothetical protein
VCLSQLSIGSSTARRDAGFQKWERQTASSSGLAPAQCDIDKRDQPMSIGPRHGAGRF